MRLTRLETVSELDEFYETVLRPCFPPSELCSLKGLRRGVARGDHEVWAVLDEGGRMIGGAVGEWQASSRVMLLAYLAVVAGDRGSGVGSFLIERVVQPWAQRYQPCIVLAEVEHPARHAARSAFGDPAARLRFYGRHGSLALDLPYFQPSLGGPDQFRVYGVLLLALHVDAELQGAGSPRTVAPGPLRVFLEEYFRSAEGKLPDDPAGIALWQSLEAPGGVAILPLERIDEIPVSEPPAPVDGCVV